MSGGLAVGLAAEAVPAWAGSESVIHTFELHHAARDGDHPTEPLIKVGRKLYGTTTTSVFEVTTKGKFHVVKLLHYEGLQNSLLNVSGLLYGTLTNGGAPRRACRQSGCGTVYSLTPQGTKKVIYTFKGGTDGSYPTGLLTVGGLLYGTTFHGGDANDMGTAFSLTPQGTETVFYRFGKNTNNPLGLIYAGGVFYGTDYRSTAFKLSKSGAEKVVGSLAYPLNNPIDIGGVLYGTEAETQNGDVYALTLQGVKTIIYAFKGGSDGNFPYGNLINVGGTMYGVTGYGGGTGCGGSGCGTVYSLTPQGNYTLIYAFKGSPDGSNPQAGLLDVDGTLYGTTYYGGDRNCSLHRGCGTIYAITP